MINNDILDNQNELNELKNLLFEDEIVAFNTLEDQIKKLHLEVNDTEQVIAKIKPLFDDLLLEKFKDKDERTIEIYAEYLAKIINKSTKNNLPELSQSLQNVISPAIKKEIADNKDTMIDALYPIMGGMISKYVTQAIKEMMESINNKIEDGLTFNKYKRKVKSKISGVSETELLIEESIEARISSLFVIHKESGLLISEAHLKDKEIDDPHMIASMASAIKDFINDWIQSHDAQSEVQILSYGNATLYIESAGSVYMIAFLDAEPDYEQRTKINTFFAKVVKKYASFFQRFEGDDTAPEVETLSYQMDEYLNNQVKDEKKSSNTLKYLFYFLFFILLMYGAYRINGWYDIYHLENRVYEETGEKITIDRKNDIYILNGQVHDMEDIYQIDKIVDYYTNVPIVNKLIIPMKAIDKQIKEKSVKEKSIQVLEDKLELLDDKYQENIHSLTKEMESIKNSLLDSNKRYNSLYKGSKKIIDDAEKRIEVLEQKESQITYLLHLEDKIFLELDKAFKGNNYYNKDKHSLDFRNLALFTASESEYDKKAIKEVELAFEKYLNILIKYKEYLEYIYINGHSDSSGTENDNLKLSYERALMVKEYLDKLDIVQKNKLVEYLAVNGYGSSQIIIKNEVEDRIASRRIEIGFELKIKNIINTLKTLVND